MVTYIPGTTLPYPRGAESAFSVILPLITVAGGLSLSQVSAITGLEGSTVQNWVKRRWVPKPVDKKYGLAHLPRILLIGALRDNLQIEQIVALISYATAPVGTGTVAMTEAGLYDCLCAAVRGLPLSGDGILDTRVRALAQARCGNDGMLQKRLEETLSAMSMLYIAGVIKRRALDQINQFL
ncbi:DUF1836 domain-containing protein [Intestinibacillus massiliensis]|nr:DUF1836 domain-containing protein [Intestinibacillus massiliensis]